MQSDTHYFPKVRSRFTNGFIFPLFLTSLLASSPAWSDDPAVELPSNITIIKQSMGGDEFFPFTSPPGPPVPGFGSIFPFFNIQTTFGAGAQSFFNLPPGIHSVTETTKPGWELTDLFCTDPDGGTTVILDSGTVNIDLDAGENIICTFTNTKDATLVIKKVTVPAGSTDVFLFMANFGKNWDVPNIPVTPLMDTETASQTGQPGLYGASEVPLPGYVITNISCTGQTLSTIFIGAGTAAFEEGDNAVNVTLAAGEVVTCEFVNTAVASLPKLTLIKDPTNDNGGNAMPDDFLLTVGGNLVSSGVKLSYEADTPLAIDETQLPGYTFVSITGNDKCPTELGGTITLEEGDDITCTITNDDVAPKLKLIKDPTNDNGGEAMPDDFLLTVGGNAVSSGVSAEYEANTPLAINETQLPGYTFVSITGNAKCPAVLGGTITLDEGDDITCTITNDDAEPVELIFADGFE